MLSRLFCAFGEGRKGENSRKKGRDQEGMLVMREISSRHLVLLL